MTSISDQINQELYGEALSDLETFLEAFYAARETPKAVVGARDPRPRDVRTGPASLADVGTEIDRRVHDYCRAEHLDPKRDYKLAFDAVLASDPELKAAYSAS